MKLLPIISIAIVITGCTTLPQEYEKSEGKSCIRAMGSKNVGLEINSVNDGETIFVNGYQLPDKIWVYPGEYKLSLTSKEIIDTYTGKTYVNHSEILLNVEESMSYELKAAPDNSINIDNEIYVNMIQTKHISKTGRKRDWVKADLIPKEN